MCNNFGTDGIHLEFWGRCPLKVAQFSPKDQGGKMGVVRIRLSLRCLDSYDSVDTPEKVWVWVFSKGDCCSWYRDVFFGISRFLDPLFGIEIYLASNLQDVEAQKSTHGLIPGRR